MACSEFIHAFHISTGAVLGDVTFVPGSDIELQVLVFRDQWDIVTTDTEGVSGRGGQYSGGERL